MSRVYQYQPYVLGDLAYVLARDMVETDRERVVQALPIWAFFTGYGRPVGTHIRPPLKLESGLLSDLPHDCLLAVFGLQQLGWTVTRSNMCNGTYAVLMEMPHQPKCVIWCVQIDFFLSGSTEPRSCIADPIRLEAFDELAPMLAISVSTKDKEGVCTIRIKPPVQGSLQWCVLWGVPRFTHCNNFCKKGASFYKWYTDTRCAAVKHLGATCTQTGMATSQLMDLCVGSHTSGGVDCTCGSPSPPQEVSGEIWSQCII